MILQLPNLENCQSIDLSNDCVYVIECENRPTFRNIVANFKNKGYNKIDACVLDGDNRIDLEKCCCVIADYFDFSIKSKNLTSKIYKKIIATNEQEINLQDIFQSIYIDIIKHIDNLIINTKIHLKTSDTIDTEDFFKFANLSIVESDIPFDRLKDFIELNSAMKLFKILLLVNPKSFFSDAQMTDLYRHALYNESKILILENRIRDDLLENEKKICIDNELYDFPHKSSIDRRPANPNHSSFLRF